MRKETRTKRGSYNNSLDVQWRTPRPNLNPKYAKQREYQRRAGLALRTLKSLLPILLEELNHDEFEEILNAAVKNAGYTMENLRTALPELAELEVSHETL